ncbi:hypothetical protein [Streptomyces griseoluteus]
MSDRKTEVWVGVGAGKGHHWAAAIDETGATLWSKKIENDQHHSRGTQPGLPSQEAR